MSNSKEINIKNGTYYCFDDKLKIEDFNFENILPAEKSYGNILIYDIPHKTLIGVNSFCIRFNKVDGCIRVYDGTRYLVLFGGEKYGSIYNTIRYLIWVKSGITYVFPRHYAKIKVNSYYSVPLEKTLAFHNVIIHIKLLWNKDQNHYYYNTFLEKCSYQLAKNSDNK